MATVNLGRIKPVFRGAYNNSTAYVIDDIVTSGNETFIAIAATQGNATTDASKWTKLAAKGADGTDVGAILANKEIAFKTNAGAIDGIPIGTAGQFLKVNSGATGYEFGAVTSGIVQFKTNHASSSVSQATTASTSYQDVGLGMSITITPTSTSNKILLFAQGATQASSGRTYFTFNKAGDSSGNGDLHTLTLHGSSDSVANIESNSPDGNDFISFFMLDDNINSTNALTYKLRFRDSSGNNTHFGVASSVPIMYAIELDSGVL
jgi:hypothetical protein